VRIRQENWFYRAEQTSNARDKGGKEERGAKNKKIPFSSFLFNYKALQDLKACEKYSPKHIYIEQNINNCLIGDRT
jgi:hypothetical protein